MQTSRAVVKAKNSQSWQEMTKTDEKQETNQEKEKKTGKV